MCKSCDSRYDMVVNGFEDLLYIFVIVLPSIQRLDNYVVLSFNGKVVLFILLKITESQIHYVIQEIFD